MTSKLGSGVPFDNEKASPGFYSAIVNQNITLQATVGVRSSIEEYRFDSESNFLLINLGRNLSKVDGAAIRIISKSEIAGHQQEGRFCNRSAERTLYFVVRFSEPAEDMQIFDGNALKDPGVKYLAGNKIGAAIHLGNRKKALVKVGISYVSEKNARENLEHEITDWSFQKTRESVEKQWEDKLSKIDVAGGTTDDKTKFYTALYHILLHPNYINDVNGDYPLMGNQRGIGNYKSRNRYTVFSLWDTYRTVHPLLTLVYPELQEEMLKTMVDMYRESGQLPKWEVGASESYTMVGDPAAIVIADSYAKGIRNFDIKTAYKALLEQAKKTEGVNHVRPGYNSYVKYGYIPNDDKGGDYVWGSVSTSLGTTLPTVVSSRSQQRSVIRKMRQNLPVGRWAIKTSLIRASNYFVQSSRTESGWKILTRSTILENLAGPQVAASDLLKEIRGNIHGSFRMIFRV
ncbi:MAG: GH92 family glycosyl hydrolase [Acidobacteria bacterium]|nr:GH92 family glycosyl hydrolase [Acidobacteriota bacterium]